MRIAMAPAIAAVLLAIQPMPASAAEPLSGWKIEPSDARCVAVRQYGSADKPITLALKASTTGNGIQAALLRSGYRRGFLQTNASIVVDGKSFSSTALSYPLGNDKRRVAHLLNLDADASGALRTAKSMKLTIIEGINDSFAIEPSFGLWRELQDCVARLRHSWNISDERRVHIATNARGDLRGVFSAEDYPVRAMMEGETGSTRVGLLIDESGSVRDCTLITASGIAMLDSRSCGIITERARFSPALDAGGKPVKSYREQVISWRLAGGL